jgi:hypothetical protein
MNEAHFAPRARFRHLGQHLCRQKIPQPSLNGGGYHTQMKLAALPAASPFDETNSGRRQFDLDVRPRGLDADFCAEAKRPPPRRRSVVWREANAPISASS